MNRDLRKFGGVPMREAKSYQVMDDQTFMDAVADPDSEIQWNFGIDLRHPQRMGMAEDIWSTYQAGASDRAMVKLPLREWDGKTSTARMAMTKRVKHHGNPGAFLPAQYQPTGTCVGRGASGAINVFEALLILQGAPYVWQPVSHAWCYGGARMQYNDLGNFEGATGKGAFEWCRDRGVCYQQEAGDTDYFKDGVAAEWARRGIPSGIIALGKDNLLTDAFPVTSAKKAADVLFSGGAVTVASNRGFTSVRDAEGFCRPSGSWAHQMHFVDVVVTPNGRKGLACVQSWGEDAQSGPKLTEQPGYVFGVDWDMADAMLRVGDSMGAMNFEGWLEELSWGT